MAWSNMVSMELDDEDRHDSILPIAMPDKAQYPYGLRICLTQCELEKLNLSVDGCSIGAVVDLRAFAVVTSISASDGESGQQCRIELQIEKLAVENEMTEDD